uniref:terminase small subunit n=1 Tax=Candidatus Scatocola faecigallinarum TaxID=2840916 RepID=UPI004024F143
MLTAKQEKFCQNIAKGMNQSEAYRNAFNISKAKQESVHTLASRLLKKVEVKSRLSELKQQTTEEIKYTVEDSFRKLSEIQVLALKNKKLSDAIKAEELKGKLKGLYVEKREISGGLDLTPFKIDVVE